MMHTSCSNREVIDPTNLARPMAFVDGAEVILHPSLLTASIPEQAQTSLEVAFRCCARDSTPPDALGYAVNRLVDRMRSPVVPALAHPRVRGEAALHRSCMEKCHQ
jgi:hypothetical protein